MNDIFISIDPEFNTSIKKKKLRNCIVSSINHGALDDYDESISLSITSNKKLEETPRKYQQDVHEDYAQEVADIYAGKSKGKK